MLREMVVTDATDLEAAVADCNTIREGMAITIAARNSAIRGARIPGSYHSGELLALDLVADRYFDSEPIPRTPVCGESCMRSD